MSSRTGTTRKRATRRAGHGLGPVAQQRERVVVEGPAAGHAALGVGQLALEAQERLVGRQLGVGLRASQHLSQLVGLLRRPRGSAPRRPASPASSQRSSVTASKSDRSCAAWAGDRGREGGDQVVPALQLHPDEAPRPVDALGEQPEPVVGDRRPRPRAAGRSANERRRPRSIAARAMSPRATRQRDADRGGAQPEQREHDDRRRPSQPVLDSSDRVDTSTSPASTGVGGVVVEHGLARRRTAVSPIAMPSSVSR